jgi:hypothetical protein
MLICNNQKEGFIMRTVFAFFAARRYWTDETMLKNAYTELSKQVASLSDECYLITDEEGLAQLKPAANDVLVVVPMSGAVQILILSAAKRYSCVAIYAGYIKGNASAAITERMLMYNAAPTVMDSWGVLRRDHSRTLLALDSDQLEKVLRVFKAWDYIHGSKVILVGEMEPWVISPSRDMSYYTERLGITIEKVPQQEVADLYRSMPDSEGLKYYNKYKTNATKIAEPTDEDIKNASRMAAALEKTMENHNASGMAIACFNLLSVGTNACLGVSYINDCTDKIAACEGDMDSLCTMMIMKKLTSARLWMANPGLHPDGTINFSHCTAPLNANGLGDCPFSLRSHHESGIGVSLQVDFPIGQRITACRISDNASKMTIHSGVSVPGEYETCCRTQCYVKLDDYQHYLNTVLGCHQVIAFEDITEELKMEASLLGLEVL